MNTFPGNREIILETVRYGQQLKVCAVDVATGVEVSVLAPLNSLELDRNRIAMRKLHKRLVDLGHLSTQEKTPPKKGRGFSV